jgi:photosystem II stability/assembly factor-like uncharacterized protein
MRINLKAEHLGFLLVIGAVLAANASTPGLTQPSPSGISFQASESTFSRMSAVTTAALFKSEDSGVAWARIPEPQVNSRYIQPPEKSLGSIISELVLDPENASTIYANVVFRTQTPMGAQVLFRARGLIFRSTDAGKKWVESNPLGVRTNPTGAPAYSTLVVDPSNTSRLCAAAGNIVLRSTNRGGNWSEILNIVPVRKFAVDPSDGNTLYALSVNAILKSSNSGKNWAALAPQDVGSLNSLVIDPRDPRNLFVSTRRGVLKSSNGGLSWIGASAGLGEVFVSDIAIDPSNSSVLFAVTSTDGKAAVYKSTDRGDSWIRSTQMDALIPTGIAIAPTSPASVYVWGGNSIGFRSLDAGTTWTALLADPPASTEVSALAIRSRI